MKACICHLQSGRYTLSYPRGRYIAFLRIPFVIHCNEVEWLFPSYPLSLYNNSHREYKGELWILVTRELFPVIACAWVRASLGSLIALLEC